MPESITEKYLIDQAGIDWERALSSWHWLVPRRFTIWLVNRFADLFIVTDDGIVHMLDIQLGTFTQVATSRNDFYVQLDDDDTADDWLMIPIVDRMVAAGLSLERGQCFGFKKPTIMGGDYTVENCAPIAIADYIGAYGEIHEQLCDVPDGTEVILHPINLPP